MKFEKFELMIKKPIERCNPGDKIMLIEVKGVKINDSYAVVENPLTMKYHNMYEKSLIHIQSGITLHIFDHISWKEALLKASNIEISKGLRARQQLQSAIEKRNKAFSKTGKVYKVKEGKVMFDETKDNIS